MTDEVSFFDRLDEDEREEIAMKNFYAYRHKANELTFDGRKIPHWADLGDTVRASWLAGTKAIYDFALSRKSEDK